MKNLKKFREDLAAHARRYSVAEASRVVGVSAPTYRKLEQNPQLITYVQAERLAKYLGCSTEDIFLASKGN